MHQAAAVTSSFERHAAIKRSPAWDGRVFHNRQPTTLGGFDLRTMRRFLLERNDREPPAPLPSVPVHAAQLQQRPTTLDGGVQVTWLGHSTAWIELDGFTVLIDPVWGKRASPLAFAGPRRFQPVPIALDELPLPDVVVVSHDHYDHLDHATVLRLGERGATFVTALGVGGRLEGWGVPAAQIHELDWWQTWEAAGARIAPGAGLAIHALPAQHFSGRGPGDRNRTLWASWCIEASRGASAHRVYFGGDGGLDEENFATIGTHFGGFDLTMLEIGAFDLAWQQIHLGPVGALAAHRLLRGDVLLPVHWGTFNLGLHAWDAPGEELLVAAAGTDVRLALPMLGQRIVLGQELPVAPWWRAIRPASGT